MVAPKIRNIINHNSLQSFTVDDPIALEVLFVLPRLRHDLVRQGGRTIRDLFLLPKRS
jgi:hypothetical protein